MVKNLPAMQETYVQSLGQEDPLEKEMTTHSSISACRIPWTEEPGRLYSPWGHKESDTLTITHSLNYNAVLISAIQQNYSLYIHIYVFIFTSIMVYHRILNIVICALQ